MPTLLPTDYLNVLILVVTNLASALVLLQYHALTGPLPRKYAVQTWFQRLRRFLLRARRNWPQARLRLLHKRNRRLLLGFLALQLAVSIFYPTLLAYFHLSVYRLDYVRMPIDFIIWDLVLLVIYVAGDDDDSDGGPPPPKSPRGPLAAKPLPIRSRAPRPRAQLVLRPRGVSSPTGR